MRVSELLIYNQIVYAQFSERAGAGGWVLMATSALLDEALVASPVLRGPAGRLRIRPEGWRSSDHRLIRVPAERVSGHTTFVGASHRGE